MRAFVRFCMSSSFRHLSRQLSTIILFLKGYRVLCLQMISRTILNGLDRLDLIVELSTSILEPQEQRLEVLSEVKKKQEAAENQDLTLGSSI